MPLLDVQQATRVNAADVVSDPPKTVRRTKWYTALEQVAECFLSGEFGRDEWVKIATFDAASGARVKAKVLQAKPLPYPQFGEFFFAPTTHVGDGGTRTSSLHVTYVVNQNVVAGIKAGVEQAHAGLAKPVVVAS